MTQYFGDFSEDQSVYIPFNTFDSNDPSASVTITNLADADIKVHKDGSATQIVTDGATVAIDFDSITGNHLITIDTSAHADYSTGSDYMVRIEGTTVDGATINAWVGSFSIENRHSAGALRPTTAGRTLDVTATGAAGIDWGNVENQSTAVDLSATDIQLCDTITTYTGNTVQTGDSYARLGAPAGVSVSADNAAIKAETASILVDTAEIGAAGAGLTALGTAAELAKVPKSDSTVTWNATALASINAECDTALADYDGPTNTEFEARTLVAAGYATATNLATVDTNVDAILVDTGTTIPAQISGLNDVAATDIVSGGAITTSGGAVSNVTLCATTTTNTDMRGTDSALLAASINLTGGAVDTVTDVTNRVTANTDQIAGNATSATNLQKSALAITVGAAVSGTLSTTQMSTDLAEATDDHYIGLVIKWTSGVLSGQGTDITDYDGTTKVLTYTATTEAPSNTDTFVIL
jgi:hypothetical protein